MLPAKVGDNEDLYRGIHPSWVDRGRVTSQLFKDGSGASVDRDGGRDPTEAIRFLQGHTSKDHGVATIGASVCRELKAEVTASPQGDNKYHAHVHEPGKPSVKGRRVLQALRDSATVLVKARVLP